MEHQRQIFLQAALSIDTPVPFPEYTDLCNHTIDKHKLFQFMVASKNILEYHVDSNRGLIARTLNTGLALGAENM